VVKLVAYALGVDIGGTKVAAMIMREDGQILKRSEVASTPTDKEEMFNQVIKCIEMLLNETNVSIQEITGIGVGIPGKVDRENGIAVYQNNLSWTGFPIVKRLQDYFSYENIVIDNDVYMAAFAEWKTSTTNIQDTFVYLTISTGISCSIIHQGSFIRGNGFAGELGLLPVFTTSAKGSMERLEKTASGPAIKKLAEKSYENNDFTTSEFFKRYKEEDPEAKIIMKEVVDSLAHGIYSIICLIDPHKIVIGGGVMNNHPFILSLIKESLKQYLIPEQLHSLSRLYLSELKENSGIIGACLKGIDINN